MKDLRLDSPHHGKGWEVDDSLVYAGTVKVGAMVFKDAQTASVFRNTIKQFFRGGDPSKAVSYAQLSASGASEAQILRKAGKTNKYYNS